MTYKLYGRFGVRFVVKTEEEESDIKSIFPALRQIDYSLMLGREDLLERLDDMADDIGSILDKVNRNEDDSLWSLLLLVFSLSYLTFFALLCAGSIIKRIYWQNLLYQEEMDNYYADTKKTINDKYEKRILGLAGIPEEKHEQDKTRRI